jgi:regulator of sigma E protease
MESLIIYEMQGLWWEWLWPILQFIIGLGLVVFVHELGHFTMAKVGDIKVEQFALGFGPRIFGFKARETDYRVNLLPLGGYVKMVGQEDFGTVEDLNESDPRAFNNKPVSTRFAVISAGVVMNVIFAGVLFVMVCLIGIRFPAPIVGGSLPGSPAHKAEIHWQTIPGVAARTPTTALSKLVAGPVSSPEVTVGLEPGYRVLRVNDQTITRFSQLPIMASLADRHATFKMTIERRVGGQTQIGTTEIGVMPLGGTLGFGLMPALSTTFGGLGNYIADDPFKEGDRILAINGQRVQHSWQIEEMEDKLDGAPVTVTVSRENQILEVDVQPDLRMSQGVFFMKDGMAIRGEIIKFTDDGEAAFVRLPNKEERRLVLKEVIWPATSELLDILGLVPRLRIAGVVRGSPADKSGLRPGDIIAEYGGTDTPTIKQFLKISDQAEGGETQIVVIRNGKALPPISIPPTRHMGRIVVGILQGMDERTPVIAQVRKGSPAESAGLQGGDVFTGVNGRQVANWIDLFQALKDAQGKSVTLTYRRAGRAQGTAETAVFTDTAFDAGDYRYVLFSGPRGFTLLMGGKVKKNPVAAIGWGARETWDFIAMTYASLAGFFKGTVSYKEFSGPVGIGTIAIQAGREGITAFMYFMAMISVSLAVLNFLPFPVVDGGHAVFLIIEKIRGRPLPLKVQNHMARIGWAVLLYIMIALTWNDLSKILQNLW